ncbi:MAG TPA: glutamate formimidoyltransferase [Actinomycetota bacterium]
MSEGRDAAIVTELSDALCSAGARVLDVHVDPVHNRTVLTATGAPRELVDGTAALARAAVTAIDLRIHEGAHPRVGALDVCPIVPHDEPIEAAVDVARAAGDAMVEAAGVPVYFYDFAADPPKRLPEIRAGGLDRLISRAAEGFVPDLGPRAIDPRVGVVCVGARRALIAFNVYVSASQDRARALARTVRERDGGLPGVRAIGIELEEGLAQVSMNLVDPDRTGIEETFAAVANGAKEAGVDVLATELVGLVPERYLPSPDARAARLLIEPGRSVESLLG